MKHFPLGLIKSIHPFFCAIVVFISLGLLYLMLSVPVNYKLHDDIYLIIDIPWRYLICVY